MITITMILGKCINHKHNHKVIDDNKNNEWDWKMSFKFLHETLSLVVKFDTEYLYMKQIFLEIDNGIERNSFIIFEVFFNITH